MDVGDTEEKRSPLLRWLGLALVLIAFALPLRGAAGDVGGAMEEGFMLVFPERVLAGAVPNRDFLHLYGPGSLWVLAAAFALFGVRIGVERTIGALQLVAVVLALRAWLRPWGEGLATGCALLCVLFAITPIGLVALAWMGGLGLLLWGLLLVVRAVEGAAGWRPVAGGVLVGFALLYRPDLVLAAALGGVVLLGELRRRQLWRRVLGGFAAGVAPMLVHVALAGVGSSIRGMVLDPVLHLRPGRRLPVPPSTSSLDGFLQRVNELDVIDWPRPFTLPIQMRTWFFVVVLATALLVVAAVVATRRPDPTPAVGMRALRLRVLAAVALGILPQAMQRPDSAHLAWVSCFTLAALPVALAELLPDRWRSRAGGLVGMAAVAALVTFAFPAFTLRPYAQLVRQTFGVDREAIAVRHAGRTFYVGRPDLAVAVEEVLDAADRETRPGDRVFVGPSDLTRTPFVDSWLYHLLPDLVPATYFVEMDPGIANAPGSRLAEDLSSADVVVLTDTWEKWEEPNTSAEAGDPAAAKVLAEEFCPVTARDGISLFRRCR